MGLSTWETLGTFGAGDLGAGIESGGSIEVSGFSKATLVKPDPTLSASSSESPPYKSLSFLYWFKCHG